MSDGKPYPQTRPVINWPAQRGIAAFLSVLYHSVVRDVRRTHSNAFLAIGSEVAQAMVLVVVIMVFLSALNIGQFMVRGNAMLSVLTGVFLFLVHNRAFTKVLSAASPGNPIFRHPTVTPVLIYYAAALSSLYIQTLALGAMLLITHVFYAPVQIDALPRAALAFGLAWFSGFGAGVLAAALKLCAPKLTQIAASLYARANMFFSGKMMLAGSLPGAVLGYFLWNPLFHTIDQARGAVFINYTATKTNLSYPFLFGFACLVLGLMIGHKAQARGIDRITG